MKTQISFHQPHNSPNSKTQNRKRLDLAKLSSLKQIAISHFENLGKSPTLKFLFELLKELNDAMKIVLEDEEMIKSYQLTKRGSYI